MDSHPVKASKDSVAGAMSTAFQAPSIPLLDSFRVDIKKWYEEDGHTLKQVIKALKERGYPAGCALKTPTYDDDDN
jgi:hypothetical protein